MVGSIQYQLSVVIMLVKHLKHVTLTRQLSVLLQCFLKENLLACGFFCFLGLLFVPLGGSFGFVCCF